MRVVLFYSEVESFNYFTGQLEQELRHRGHETFILDLCAIYNPVGKVIERQNAMSSFQKFIEDDIHLVISFDGLGITDEVFIDLWNMKQAFTINILMDHPLRFHPIMRKHPRKYFQFCCDLNHVKYVKTYFEKEVEHVKFLPHAGTLPSENSPRPIPFAERKYDILFSGTYYRPEEQLAKINQYFEEGTIMNQFYQVMTEYLLSHSNVTTEQAVLDTLQRLEMNVSEEQIKTIFRCSEPIDWMVRMYHRERVVAKLAEEGFEIWLLGRGWEKHPSADRNNVHRIADRIPFEQTFSYMADSKINLNVMPWFKAGTHDRIFNILLQHSLPLTDSSAWIDDNFTDGVDIALYDLEKLDELPNRINKLLTNVDDTEAMIERGFTKVKEHFVWKNCVDEILHALENSI